MTSKKKTFSIGQNVKLIGSKRSGKITDRYIDIQNDVIDYTIELDDGTVVGTSNKKYIEFKNDDKTNDKKGGEVFVVKPQHGVVIDKLKRKYIVKLNNNAIVRVYCKQLIDS